MFILQATDVNLIKLFLLNFLASSNI